MEFGCFQNEKKDSSGHFVSYFFHMILAFFKKEKTTENNSKLSHIDDALLNVTMFAKNFFSIILTFSKTFESLTKVGRPLCWWLVFNCISPD
jgi:hypothetical protein